MRKERDSMGEMELPDKALYGAQTQRAVLNFPISGIRFPRSFINALGLIKWAAVEANESLGWVAPEKSSAIRQAALEVAEGRWDDQFVVDIFQTGSGTSTNMNANEVIANRAAELLGGARGDRGLVHPNDEVNCSQSSNDVIPSALHVAAMLSLRDGLQPALAELEGALEERASAFAMVVKCGRTHLQDAVPVTLGQEMGGYAAQIRYGRVRLEAVEPRLRELALGGTAVGTGVNAHPEFAKLAISALSQKTNFNFTEASNHFEAQGARDTSVELSGQLRTVACSLLKIANDIRWMAAGPRCSLAEISIPEVQPGSSIMPGKVNPVIIESVRMVCVQVLGNDAAIAAAGQHGEFELNVMIPVVAHNLLQSISLLGTAASNFAANCISGIAANEARCSELAERSLALCTALAPKLGYDATAKLAKLALDRGQSIKETVVAEGVLSKEEAERLLDPLGMTAN